jgi:hypothetical protein
MLLLSLLLFVLLLLVGFAAVEDSVAVFGCCCCGCLLSAVMGSVLEKIKKMRTRLLLNKKIIKQVVRVRDLTMVFYVGIQMFYN